MSDSQEPDPTPEEIAERCAEIRAGWTEAERQRRLRCDLRDPVPGRMALQPHRLAASGRRLAE